MGVVCGVLELVYEGPERVDDVGESVYWFGFLFGAVDLDNASCFV